MSTMSENSVMFVNLDTVTNVFVWDGQLTASLDGAGGDVRVGDIAIALRGGYVVAVGRITERSSLVTSGYGAGKNWYAYKVWVRMNLRPEPLPVLLSAKQQNALMATAKQYGRAYPGFKNVLAIPQANMPCFTPLLNRLRSSLRFERRQAEQIQSSRLFHIMDRDDISGEAKIILSNALCCRGELAELVYARDEHRNDTDHELDWVATRIVPWEACTDEERTDPNNYVLMDEQLAEHFAMGMVSFRNTGNQIYDSAMDTDAFDSSVDPDFKLPALNKHQKKYMAYHRAHVYKQWRSGLPKPMYLPAL